MLDNLKTWLEIVNHGIVIFGLPIAIYTYLRTTRKERKQNEDAVYNALDDRFIEFQRMCLDRPELDIFDVPDAKLAQPLDEKKKKEIIAFTILFSIFERAYTAYKDQSKSFRKKQWSGWETYIRQYCARPNFVSAWKRSGNTFDEEFQKHMHEKYGLK